MVRVDICVGVITKELPLDSNDCLFYALVSERQSPEPPPPPPLPGLAGAEEAAEAEGTPAEAGRGSPARRTSWPRRASMAR